MFDSIAAIDIGSSSVKLVLAKRGLRDYHITDLIEESVDLSSGETAEAQTRAIEKLLSRQSIKNANPLVNLPLEKAIIRHIEFPFTDKARIAEVIPFEAQEGIPFKIEDLDMDFQFLGPDNVETGRVLVAATHTDTISEFSLFLENSGIHPVHVGLESNALFECYSYFAYNDDENVLVLDIGYSKTIVNIIRDNVLLFTRCIGSGVGSIISDIADSNKISEDDARSLLKGVRLDLTDFDATVTRGGYKNYGLTKPKLRAIHALATGFAKELSEQTNLTIKSFVREFGAIEFQRMLISGGGSHLTGIGSILSKKTGIHTERVEFPIAVGMALSYFAHRNDRINFLKGEFRPSYLPSARGKYRIAIAFGCAGMIILIANLLISFIFQAIDAQKYHATLETQFKQLFQNRTIETDPVSDAEKIVAAEKKELKALTDVIPPGPTVVQTLSDLTAQFSADPSFQIKTMLIDNENVRIDGECGSGSIIDTFKNKLIESKKFESVTPSTTMARRDLVNFSIVIKLKKPGSGKGVR